MTSWLIAAAAEAQTRPAHRVPEPSRVEDRRTLWFGPQLSYADDVDFGPGARLLWARPGRRPLDLIVSVDTFFPPSTEGAAAVDIGHWEANANVAYRFGRRVQPYAGGGLNLARRSATLRFLGEETKTSETKVGANLLAGARWRWGRRLRPFVEARVETEGGEQKLMTAGILF